MITYNITYQGIDIHVLNNSMRIINKRSKQIRHYPNTDISSKVDSGRQATTISCEIVAFNEAEKLLMEQLLSSDILGTLYLNGEGRYYKEVTHDEEFEMTQETRDGQVWTAAANFLALDPMPYDVDTDEVMY
ncbi:MAG TPA: hypothetical protein VJ877_00125 [Bacteroidales bacterium]|nr:hypothetical protein [Bacteroidales bacterium]